MSVETDFLNFMEKLRDSYLTSPVNVSLALEAEIERMEFRKAMTEAQSMLFVDERTPAYLLRHANRFLSAAFKAAGFAVTEDSPHE